MRRQERGERIGLGEALTVKSIGTTHIPQYFYPDFKPPSPKTPFRPPSVAGDESYSKNLPVSVCRKGGNILEKVSFLECRKENSTSGDAAGRGLRGSVACIAGARHTTLSPLLTSLGTFLFSDKKVPPAAAFCCAIELAKFIICQECWSRGKHYDWYKKEPPSGSSFCF